jgi:RHS repeat-associated protein
MQKLSRMRGALVAVSCGVLWSVAAQAQLPMPPAAVRPSVDENGVELVTGTFQYATQDISIGQPGAGGLTFGLSYRAGYPTWSNPYLGNAGFESNDGVRSTYFVSIGDYSETFYRYAANGPFVPAQGGGTTLTETATTYTHTATDGTVTVLTRTYPGGILTQTLPDGEVRTFNYVSVNQCIDAACTMTSPTKRLQSVTNNRGYQIKLSYASSIVSGNVPSSQNTAWNTITGAIALNMAYDWCDPFVNGCSGMTQSWPSVTYGYGAGETIITDQLGGSTHVNANGGYSVAIRWPGSQTDNVVYGLDTNSWIVTSFSRNGKLWSYSRTNSANNGGEITTEVTDPAGRKSTYVFDLTTHVMKSYKNTAGEITTYQNDTSGRPVLVTLPSGQSFHYVYDLRGNITETRLQAPGVADLISTANFDSSCTQPKKCNKPNWTIDPAGNRTDYTYGSAHGNLTVVQLPAVSVNGTSIRPRTDYTYTTLAAYYKNSSGALVAGSNIYYLTRSWQCRTTSACADTSADAVRTDIGYGNSNVANNRLPRTVTLRDGGATLTSTTTMEYDVFGNATAVDGPLSGTVDRSVTRYDALRRVTWSAGPDIGVPGTPRYVGVHTSYDDRGDPTSVETGSLAAQDSSTFVGPSPVQGVTRTFDADHRVTKTLLAGGATTFSVQQVTYDTLGRVDCTATRMNPAYFGAPPSSACDPAPDGVSPQDFGPDRITKFNYDNADRPTSTISGYQKDPITDKTISYLSGGLPQTLTDGKGNKTTYSYDPYGRLYRIYYPDPATVGQSSSSDYEEFAYNLNSQVTSSFTRVGHIEIKTPRDAAGRVTARQVIGGPVAVEDLTFNYDLQGRLIGALNASNAGITQTYDGLGRLSTKTAYGKQLGYLYYSNGLRQRLTYPGGAYVEYTYNNAGALRTIADNTGALLATYGYDGLGSLTDLTRGANSGATSFTPDAIQRLQQLTQTATGLNLQATFQYNPAGQIAKRTVNNDAAYTWTPPTPNSTVSSPVDGQNQLTSLGGVTVTDDANGNVTTGINNLTYTYDALGELRQASGGASAVSIEYDPTGMLRRVTAASVTNFLYDGADLLATYDAGGNLLQRFVHGPAADEPVVVYDAAGNKTWLHADERGSIIAATTSSGALVSSVKYSTEGEASGALVSPFGYTGQLYLPELQLYYYKARMYSPKAGRFVQPDPMRYGGGMNLYAYVGGDPINARDPLGLQEQCSNYVGRIPVLESGTDPDGLVYFGTTWKAVPMQRCVDYQSPASPPGNRGANGGSPQGNEQATNSTPPALLCKKPPPFVGDPNVAKALNQAWSQSNPNAPPVPSGRGSWNSQKMEQGGWILMNWVTGNLLTMPVASGTRASLPIGRPPWIVYHTVVGFYHTHPNTGAEGYLADPSDADRLFTANIAKVPGVIRTHVGDKYMCP